MSDRRMLVRWTVSAPRGVPWTVHNGGEVAVLYCFLWLFTSTMGPGPWSLDALRARSRR